MKYVLVPMIAAGMAVGAAGQAQPAGNSEVDAIIQMVEAGLSENLILRSIVAAGKAYDVSPVDIARMQKAGATEKIIEAVLLAGPDAAQTPSPAPAAAAAPSPAPAPVQANALVSQPVRTPPAAQPQPAPEPEKKSIFGGLKSRFGKALQRTADNAVASAENTAGSAIDNAADTANNAIDSTEATTNSVVESKMNQTQKQVNSSVKGALGASDSSSGN